MKCPCSTCTSAAHRARAGHIPLLPESATTIRELTLIGSHSLQIVWEDGHSMGIYPYSYLRELAPPRERTAE
jgi:DUF971 family protein